MFLQDKGLNVNRLCIALIFYARLCTMHGFEYNHQCCIPFVRLLTHIVLVQINLVVCNSLLSRFLDIDSLITSK